MPRDGAIIFGDIEAKLADWLDVIAADCPKKSARQMFDRCGAHCPDLPKVL